MTEGSWQDRARQGRVVEVLPGGRAQLALSDGSALTASPSDAMAARGKHPEVGQAALVRPDADGGLEIARLYRFPEGREEALLIPEADPDVEYLVEPGGMRWQQSYLPYLYDWYDEWDGDFETWRRLAREEGGPILELACGTGRIVIELLREGHEVTGVDISQAMLDRAAEKITEQVADADERVDFLCTDMGEFRDDRRYALAYIACNSLHYMTPVEHRADAIRSLFHHLRPGGLGVLSNIAPENPDFPPTRIPATHLMMMRADVNPNTGLWTVEYQGLWTDSVTGESYFGPWRFVEETEDGVRRSFEFREPPTGEPTFDWPKALTRAETIALMQEAGFSDIEVRSAKDLGPAGDKDRVVVFTGRA